jgi:hypothetical protein
MARSLELVAKMEKMDPAVISELRNGTALRALPCWR